MFLHMGCQVSDDMKNMMVVQLIEHLLSTTIGFQDAGLPKASQVVAGQWLRHSGNLCEAADWLRLLETGDDQLQALAVPKQLKILASRAICCSDSSGKNEQQVSCFSVIEQVLTR